ncbi:hypothetical protein [Pseudoteredinibacter isoporae]|uniref:hypothetical protein n=1 Tax=Pseudoteredinibacter isoporae TaxID=570281 RepID=UPI003103EC18
MVVSRKLYRIIGNHTQAGINKSYEGVKSFGVVRLREKQSEWLGEQGQPIGAAQVKRLNDLE